MLFADRRDAGRRLAERLRSLRGQDVVVLGVPRGGIPVAAVVAESLAAPLDVIIVRKVGVPGRPELAMGAVGEQGVRIRNQDVIDEAGVSNQDFATAELRERAEVVERAQRFRGGADPVPLKDRTAIVVDDGAATGATSAAACRVARQLGAAVVVAAVPLASRAALSRLDAVADRVVCLGAPEPFLGVGRWYGDFRQTEDRQVVALLDAAWRRTEPEDRAEHAGDANRPFGHAVRLPAGDITVPTHVAVPPDARGLVVFAHAGAGGSAGTRDREIAARLVATGLATVLVNLRPDGASDDSGDLALLGRRLAVVTHVLADAPSVAGLPIGYLGSGSGAAVAMLAAALPRNPVAAVVCRGGRPELAGAALAAVRAPTLLIVGARDTAAVGLNHRARRRMTCRCDVAVVPRAGHLFEEPGALDAAARLAAGWFHSQLPLATAGHARVS